MSHVLSVHLDREPQFYTFEDVISGTLHLKVNKDIEVKDIQVKLQAHSDSRVAAYFYNQRNERRKEYRRESHELFYDVMTVFPPPNVRDAMKHKQRQNKTSFTLTPGEYTYPFSLKFSTMTHCGDPVAKKTANLYNSSYETGYHKKVIAGSNPYENLIQHRKGALPPSIKKGEMPLGEDTLDIRYSLKVSLHRGNFFSVDTRMERVLKFYPLGPTAIQAIELLKTCYFLFGNPVTINVPKPGVPKSKWFSASQTQPVTFTFGATTSQCLVPGSWPFSLHILSNQDAQSFTYDTKEGKLSTGVFFLTGLELGLQATTQISASGVSAKYDNFSKLFTYKGKPIRVDLGTLKQTKLPNSRFQYSIDLTEYIGHWNLPPLTPSFVTCNAILKHSFYVKATFSATENGGDSKSAMLLHPVTMLGPIMERDHEQLDYTAPPPLPEATSLAQADATQTTTQVEELPTYQEATSGSL